MLIGKLDRYTQLIAVTYSINAYGERVPAESVVDNIYMALKPKGGRMSTEADTITGTTMFDAVIRYRNDITVSPKNLLKIGNVRYLIRSINEIGRGEGLALTLELSTND